MVSYALGLVSESHEYDENSLTSTGSVNMSAARASMVGVN